MAEYFDDSSKGEGGVFNHINLNTYHYGGNNPIKYVDPDGRADKLNKNMDYVLNKLKDFRYYVPPTQPIFSEITEPRDIQLKSGNKMIAVAKGLEAMGNEGDPGIPTTSLLMAIGAAIENSDIDSIHLEFDISIDFEKK